MSLPRTRQQPRGNIYLFRMGERVITFEMLRAFSTGEGVKIEGIDYLGGALGILYRLSWIIGDVYHPDTRQFVSPQALAEKYWVDGKVPPEEWNLAYNFPFTDEQMLPLKREYSGYRVADEKMLKPRKRDSFATNANLRLTYREFGGGVSDIDVWVDWSEDRDVLYYAHCRAMDNECYSTLLASRVVSCIDLETGEPVADVVSFLREKRVFSPAERLEEAIGRLGDIFPTLLFVASADGALRKPKLELLRAVVRKVAPDDDITDAMIDKAIKKAVRIDLQEAHAIVDRVAISNPNQLAGLCKIAQRLVATRKQPSMAETAFLEYMSGKLEGVN